MSEVTSSHHVEASNAIVTVKEFAELTRKPTDALTRKMSEESMRKEMVDLLCVIQAVLQSHQVSN
jgi:hypothetical protein